MKDTEAPTPEPVLDFPRPRRYGGIDGIICTVLTPELSAAQVAAALAELQRAYDHKRLADQIAEAVVLGLRNSTGDDLTS